MAVSKEQKHLFNEKIKKYKEFLDEIKDDIKFGKSIRDPKLLPYAKMKLAILAVKKSNTLILMSRLSNEIQQIKNLNYLDDARKELSGILSELLKIVGNFIDGSLTENKDNLLKIQKMSVVQRLHLIQILKNTIDTLLDTYGQNSKWRWSFPDLYYKTAVLAKNMFDFKAYEQSRPEDDDYRDYQEYYMFMMELFSLAAKEFRSKYELSTKEVGDLQQIQKLFEFQKRVYTLTGNTSELEKVKTSLDAINEKIEAVMAEKKGKKKKKKRK